MKYLILLLLPLIAVGCGSYNKENRFDRQFVRSKDNCKCKPNAHPSAKNQPAQSVEKTEEESQERYVEIPKKKPTKKDEHNWWPF